MFPRDFAVSDLNRQIVDVLARCVSFPKDLTRGPYRRCFPEGRGCV